jgi:RimJ/RimL family protein N-acetyltransferase
MLAMQPERPVVGRTVSLGPLDVADAALYAGWVNDPRLQPFLNRPWHVSVEEERELIENLAAARDAVGFAIKLRKDESLIGRSVIWDVHPVNRTGEFAIFIGEPTRWSMGHGREATALTTIYAMEVLRLNHLELEVFTYNERALRCYDGLGFTREGIRREARLRDGSFHDSILMGILAREWNQGLRDRFRPYMDPESSGGLALPEASE